jgi:hypothetical protein
MITTTSPQLPSSKAADGITISLKGTLIPLKTTLETSKTVKLLKVFITAVPAKKASGTLSYAMRRFSSLVYFLLIDLLNGIKKAYM